MRTVSSQDRSLRPETCHSPVIPGFDEQTAAHVVLVALDLAQEGRAGPDQGHRAGEHVEQLGQLVEGPAAEHLAQRA